MINFLKKKYKWVVILILIIVYLVIGINIALAGTKPGPIIIPVIPSPTPTPIIDPHDDIYTVEINSFQNYFRVLDNDPSGAILVELGMYSLPSHGTATIRTGTFGIPPFVYPINLGIYYTPDEGYVGTDSFGYTFMGTGFFEGSASAYVYVTIVPENILPVAVEDSYTISSGAPKTLNVTQNDYDPDLDPISIPDPDNDLIQPSNGTAVVTVTGSNIIYTPNTGFTGQDS
ncbi:MAG: hypothetical protein KAH14_10580, partial [Clostridiales bacterium]|nr:hypothetical protein [Clostridiales bacterium]